jgi:hypothetical protein
MIIPSDYYKKIINVSLTQSEIDAVIECLGREEHNIFVFLSYDKLIKKLRGKK